MENIDSEKLLTLVFDTVKMVSSFSQTFTDDEIEEQLNELDGDSHTFLHYDNLIILHNAKLLSDDSLKNLSTLREKTKAIPTFKWTIRDFKENNAWDNVKHLADVILKDNFNSKKNLFKNKYPSPPCTYCNAPPQYP